MATNKSPCSNQGYLHQSKQYQGYLDQSCVFYKKVFGRFITGYRHAKWPFWYESVILLNKKKNLLEGRSLTIFANVQHTIPIAKDISRLISSSLSLSLNWHWTRVSKSEQNRWQTSSLSQDYQVTSQLAKTTFYVCQECFREPHCMILPPPCSSPPGLVTLTALLLFKNLALDFHNSMVFSLHFIKRFHNFIDTERPTFLKNIM